MNTEQLKSIILRNAKHPDCAMYILEAVDTYVKSLSAPEVNKAWDMGLTFANNLCVQISDDYNNDDAIEGAMVAGQCANKIRGCIGHYPPELVNPSNKQS